MLCYIVLAAQFQNFTFYMLTVTLKSATKLFEDSDRGDVFLDFLKLKIKNTKINFV